MLQQAVGLAIEHLEMFNVVRRRAGKSEGLTANTQGFRVRKKAASPAVPKHPIRANAPNMRASALSEEMASARRFWLTNR